IESSKLVIGKCLETLEGSNKNWGEMHDDERFTFRGYWLGILGTKNWSQFGYCTTCHVSNGGRPGCLSPGKFGSESTMDTDDDTGRGYLALGYRCRCYCYTCKNSLPACTRGLITRQTCTYRETTYQQCRGSRGIDCHCTKTTANLD